MKLLSLIALLFLVTGCGKFNRILASYTGHSKECVDGVEYVQFSSGASVVYNRDGTVKHCQE